jgi:Cu(I)/Ag(I) efflux system membrane protein CusA/SilA
MYEEMDQEFRFPGMANGWYMPIYTRIVMLSTGIKSTIGIKIMGPELETIDKLALQVEKLVRKIPGTLSAASDRVMGGYYLDFEIDRTECARHGLKVEDVLKVIQTAIGGMNISQMLLGRFRFPINVRYPRELRHNPHRLRRVLVATANGQQLPLGELATLRTKQGPAAIKSENALLQAIVYVTLKPEMDVATYVKTAQQVLRKHIKTPPGYVISWGGQYQYMKEVNQRLTVIVPVTLALIFLLLYLNFGRLTESLIVLLSLPFAAVGGIWYMWALDYKMSVAVAVGFIALAGLAAETGVVMLLYLDIALGRHARTGFITAQKLDEAIMEGAVMRLRPKMMTVVTTIMGLMPIMWSTGAGARPMKRLACPMIGGLVSSAVLTLIVIPAVYRIIKAFQLKKNGGNNHA